MPKERCLSYSTCHYKTAPLTDPDYMKSTLKNIGRTFVHSNSFVATLLRSSLVSQTSGWIDFGVSVAIFSWAHLGPMWSAGIGALAGGIANCIINYRFTFRVKDMSWKSVVVKYILVWIGSLLLNSFGTEGVYWILRRWNWLEDIGFKPSGYFTAARLFVSLVVSCAWNFALQRYFVYRHTRFDNAAIKIANFLFHGKFKLLVEDVATNEINTYNRDVEPQEN